MNAYFDHTSLDGRSPWDRIVAAGYGHLAKQGENIAAGSATPELVVSNWMRSPGHSANIMSPHFLHAGVGYATLGGAPSGPYWTLDLGAR